MNERMSRRDALRGSLLLGAVTVAALPEAHADGAVHLPSGDAAASALGYHEATDEERTGELQRKGLGILLSVLRGEQSYRPVRPVS